MPLGISESTLKAAYGPVDLSGVYKSIDAVQKRADAEEKQLRAAQQKEYYSSLGYLTKDLAGIRGEDNAEIMHDYNKWKNTEQKLLANPRLMQQDPEAYGRLSAEAETHYGSAMAKINASKAKKDYLKKVSSTITSNPTKFKKGSAELFSKISGMTTRELDENGMDDLNNFVYEGPNFEKVYKQVSDINNKTEKDSARIVKYSDNKFGGYNVYTNYEIPDVQKLQYNIKSFLSNHDTQDLDAIWERYMPQAQSVKDAYEAIPEDVFEKYKTPDGADKFPVHTSPTGKQTRKPDLPFDGNTSAEKLNAFLLASNLLDIERAKPIKKEENVTEFKLGKEGEKKMAMEYSEELFRRLEPLRQQSRQANLQLDRQTMALYNTLMGTAKFGQEYMLSLDSKITPDKVKEWMDNAASAYYKLTGEFPAAKSPLTTKEPKSNIPEYSRKDLMDAGWSLDQINQAIKAKKLKLKN